MKDSGAIVWMAKNPVAANLLMVIILVAGLLGMHTIKQEVFPEFELDMVTVSVAYPGASPEEVEQGVVLAIEEAVRGLNGIKRVGGTSNENAGVVWAELLIDADRDQVVSDVKSAVDRIQSFPEETEQPSVNLFKQARRVLSVIVAGEADLATLHSVANRLQGRLIATKGITKVEVEGVPPRELSIEVQQREIDRTELYVCQEIFLCGSGYEIMPIVDIDGYRIGDGTVEKNTQAIFDTYDAVTREVNNRYGHWLTNV